jgi:hypothetical protein
MRDTAIGGLAVLLNRADWRDSDAGASIAGRISEGLRDSNPVVRMRAATAPSALQAGVDSSARAVAIGELMLTEEVSSVRTVLVGQLAREAKSAAEAVDGVLERLLGADSGTVLDPRTDLVEGIL